MTSAANALYSGCFCVPDRYSIFGSTISHSQPHRFDNISATTQESPSLPSEQLPCAHNPSPTVTKAAAHRSSLAHLRAASRTVLGSYEDGFQEVRDKRRTSNFSELGSFIISPCDTNRFTSLPSIPGPKPSSIISLLDVSFSITSSLRWQYRLLTGPPPNRW